MMMPPFSYWPYMAMPGPQPQAQPDEDDVQSDEGPSEEDARSVEDGEVANDQEDPEPEQPGVSLAKYQKLVADDEGVGPPVKTTVADLASKIWNKSVKDDIKELYATHSRPENVPCLQKVGLDEDVLDFVPAQVKNHDFALKGLNNAFTHAAIVATKIIDTCMSAGQDTDIRQRVLDMAVDNLRIASYGAQSTHSIRTEQIRPLIHPSVKNQLKRKVTLEDINSSHCLLGGDVQTHMKKGDIATLSWLNCLFISFVVITQISYLTFLFSAKDGQGIIKQTFLAQGYRGHRSPLTAAYGQQSRGYKSHYNSQYRGNSSSQYNSQYANKGKSARRGRKHKNGGNYCPTFPYLLTGCYH